MIIGRIVVSPVGEKCALKQQVAGQMQCVQALDWLTIRS
jgi:hypothetical protein